MSFLPPENEKPLVTQPTLAPTRKLQFGISGGVIVAALIAGLTAYDPDLAATWTPVIAAIAGSLGVAVPAYLVKNRA
jgi:hypothetical protein